MTATIAQSGRQMRLEVTDSSHVGVCRRAAQDMAAAWGFGATSAGRVGIVATELAQNLVRHTRGGELLIQPIALETDAQIELLSIDRGPGMAAVQDCMRDGYSTAGTAGTGLGAVRRLSAAFDVYSRPGTGTVVLSRVATASEAHPSGASPATRPLQFGTISIPLRGEIECGDAWSIAYSDAQCSLLLVDGLGHGAFAASAAAAATAAFAAQPFAQPADAMRELHRQLSGTRGAAAACALFGQSYSRLTYAGIGNIAGLITRAGTRRGMLSHNGTLGAVLPRVQQLEYDSSAPCVVVMHSDGLSARWSLENYPDLPACHAGVIAGVLYRDYARERDDATVAVVSCLQ
jgi:anti-sigma regulatory factor (Ser/Thr protein kinase)